MPEAAPDPAGGVMSLLIQGSTAIPKSVAKLIDTVGDQVGLFLKPIHTRRQAEADATAAVTEARAKIVIKTQNEENKIVLQEIKERVEERVRQQEARRQQNIETITDKATRELPESASEDPVDPDWVAQFFTHCQDVGNEQMQVLWSKLLAGEVVKPGSYSLRTLALVKVLTKTDADLFTRFCSCVWQTPGGPTPFLSGNRTNTNDGNVGLDFASYQRLNNLGLVVHQPIGGFNLVGQQSGAYLFIYFGRNHVFLHREAVDANRVEEFPVGPCLLTDIGQELFAIAGANSDEAYRLKVVERFRSAGWEVLAE